MAVVRRERHPIGVVYIRRIAGDPGSSALRASTAGYAKRTPTGVPCRTACREITIGGERHPLRILTYCVSRQVWAKRPTCPTCGQHPQRRAPLAGARSIGIGHPRSGDRCTAPIPFPLDPDRASPDREPPSRRPARGRGLLGMAYTSVFGTACLDRCLWSGHPCGCPRPM